MLCVQNSPMKVLNIIVCLRVCLKVAGDGDANNDSRRIFPEHPNPILLAVRDNIPGKRNP